MGILDKQKVVDAEVGFRAIFEEQMLGQEARPSEMMLQEYNTGNPREVLKWLERQNGVVEWTGDRIYDKARAFEKALAVKKWSVGLEVEAEDIEDDRLMLYTPVIREMADDFVQHKWDLITTKLKAGFGGSEGLAYDGQFFFDTDHRDGPDGDVQVNMGTAALTADAFDAARIAMRKIKKANNKTANVRPTHIVVGPDLEPTAENLFNLDRLANGADNRLRGAVQIVVSNELADQPAYWFLMDLSKVMKPFAMLSKRPVTFRSQDNLTDESAMDKDLYKYAADARYDIDFWGWKVAWGSNGTT